MSLDSFVTYVLDPYNGFVPILIVRVSGSMVCPSKGAENTARFTPITLYP